MTLRLRQPQRARDLTGAIRWVLVGDAREPLQFHYPSQATAESCAGPGERAVQARVTGRAGLFSDHVELLEPAAE